MNKDQQSDYKDMEKFAYIVSHDLQGPLRRIHSFSELSRKILKTQPDKAAEYLQKIENICLESEQMIFSLLNLCKVGGQEFTKTNISLKKLINISLLPFKGSIDKNEFEMNNLLNQDHCVFVNSHQIRDVFFNLISNSLKFKKKNEHLSLIIDAQIISNDFLKISISDNGIGIKDTSKVFHFSERENKEKDGFGIGLSTCKKIIEAHQGEIWCESTYGEGASFSFTVPLALKKE